MHCSVATSNSQVEPLSSNLHSEAECIASSISAAAAAYLSFPSVCSLVSFSQIHRLPVVDESNMVVGILTRTDIYEPLMPSVNPMLHRVAGLHPGEEATNF